VNTKKHTKCFKAGQSDGSDNHFMHLDSIDVVKTIRMDFLWGVRVKVMMHKD
jgi:hypothetical protein